MKEFFGVSKNGSDIQTKFVDMIQVGRWQDELITTLKYYRDIPKLILVLLFLPFL